MYDFLQRLLFFVALSHFSSLAAEGDLPYGKDVRAQDGSYWNVVENDDGTLTNSAHSSSHIYRPNLVAPVDQQEVTDFALSFYWQQVLEPKNRATDSYVVADRRLTTHTRYVLQVATDPEFSQLVFEKRKAFSNKRGGAYFRLSEPQRLSLQEGIPYYWRVRIQRLNQTEESAYSEEELWALRGSKTFCFTIAKSQNVYNENQPHRTIDEHHPAFFVAQSKKIAVDEVVPEILRPYMIYSSGIGSTVYSEEVDGVTDLYYHQDGPNCVDDYLIVPDYNKRLPVDQHYLSLGGGTNAIAMLEYVLQREQELGLNKIIAINDSEISWQINSPRSQEAVVDDIVSMIRLAAKYGKYFIWSESTAGFLLWQAVGVNPQLAEVMRHHRDYIIVGHKNMTNPRGFISMAQVLGMRLAGYATQNLLHIEPWYWSNGWNRTPGVIEIEPDNPKTATRGVKAYPASFFAQQMLVSLTQGVSTYFITGNMTLQRHADKLLPCQLWFNSQANTKSGDYSKAIPLPAMKNHLFPMLSFVVEHNMIPSREDLLAHTPFVVGVRTGKTRNNNNYHTYGDPRIVDQVFPSGAILPEPRAWECYYPLADLLYGFDKTDWFLTSDYSQYYPLYDEYKSAVELLGQEGYTSQQSYFQQVALFYSEMPSIPKRFSYGWIPHLPQQILAENNFPDVWTFEGAGSRALPIVYIEDLSPTDDENTSFENYMEKTADIVGQVSGTYTKPFSDSEKTDIGEAFISSWSQGNKFLVMNSHENKPFFPIVQNGEIVEIRNTHQRFRLKFPHAPTHSQQLVGLAGQIKANQYILGHRRFNSRSDTEELYLFIDSHHAKEPEFFKTVFGILSKAEPSVTLVEPKGVDPDRILKKVNWLEENKALWIHVVNDYAEDGVETPNYSVVLKIEIPMS